MTGIKFENTSSISRTNNHQEDYKLCSRRLIFENLPQVGNQVKTVEVIDKLEVWQDVIFMEEKLIEQYRQTLEQLKTL